MVKRLKGWLAAVGMVEEGTYRPVRMAGNASSVCWYTPTALRYQTPSAAKRAKFGNRSPSKVPSAAIRVAAGSSS